MSDLLRYNGDENKKQNKSRKHETSSYLENQLLPLQTSIDCSMLVISNI